MVFAALMRCAPGTQIRLVESQKRLILRCQDAEVGRSGYDVSLDSDHTELGSSTYRTLSPG